MGAEKIHVSLRQVGPGNATPGGGKEKSKNNKDYLIILPDSGSRYLSKVYNDEWIKKLNYPLVVSGKELNEKLANLIIPGVQIA